MKIQHSFSALTLCLLAVRSIAFADEKPNIVIILTDDQGYADVSYNPHSPPEVSTPNIDALAHSSIICTQGYTSGHVCSPTRAGLMTGRYQQRFGIYTAGEGGSGVPRWKPVAVARDKRMSKAEKKAAREKRKPNASKHATKVKQPNANY